MVIKQMLIIITNIFIIIINRWMCGVSLKDRKRSEALYSLEVQSVAEMVRQGRLRWFGYVEGKSGDYWVSACRNVEVVEEKNRGRDRKIWRLHG